MVVSDPMLHGVRTFLKISVRLTVIYMFLRASEQKSVVKSVINSKRHMFCLN
jgi:hypothetical protein